MDLQTVLVLVLIGVAAGMLSGFVGVGGGIIMVPAMVWILGYSQHKAQGTSLAVLMLPVVALAVWNYHKQHPIDFKAVGVIALAFVAGSWMGSKGALALSPEVVKKVFGGVMIIAAIKLIFGK
jgi:uncharacterized protein